MVSDKKFKIITTALIITILLLLPLQISAEENQENKYPDLSITFDKTLSIDKIIVDRVVKYYEHIINGVEIKGDSILIHENPSDGLNIMYEKTWTDIDFEIPVFSNIEPSNYVLKKKVIFPDESDLQDVYSFNDKQEFPVACWEVIFEDGRTILYDTIGNEIGKGVTAPSPKAFLLSGPHKGEDAWGHFRSNAESWYKLWADSYTSIYNPYPSSQISPKVSDPDVELFYELAHGCSTWFVAHTSGALYRSSDVEDDMQSRPPMKFAYIGSCEAMNSVGDNTFSYEFRKGQMTDTVTVGLTHVGENPGTFTSTLNWQEIMFSFMDQGNTIYDSFTLATQLVPIVEPIVRFVGDENLKIRELVNRNPIVPYYPSPADTIDNRDIDVDLVWSGGDIDCWDVGNTEHDEVEYDIYLGTNSNPSTKIGNTGHFPADQIDISFDPGALEYDTQYYWKIVAIDSHGAETTSPVWSFRTKTQNADLDQYFTGEGYEIYSGLHTDDSNNDDGWWCGQSFTPSKNYLSSIDLFLEKKGNPDSNFDIYICDNSLGEPNTDNYLISMSVSPDYIDRSLSWIEFDFFDVYVEPGETYYILTNAKSTDDDHHFIIGSVWDNHFPDGDSWRYNSETHPWSNSESLDLCFKTYGFNDDSENGLDQQQTEVDGEIKLIEPGPTSIMGYDKIAQSFVPSLETLSRIKLMVKKEGDPNPINLAIRSSLNGNDLTTVSISAEDISDEDDQVEFDFPDIDVFPGESYFIIVTIEGGDVNNYYRMAIGYDTEYIDGIFYKHNKFGWESESNTDFWFKTYGTNNGQETYELTVNIQVHGSVTKNPDQTEYEPGTPVELTATPEEGWIFYEWSIDLTGSENPKTIIMDSDKTISAIFVEDIAELDQEQTEFDRGFAIRHESNNYWGSGQSFIPTKDTLTRVEIYLKKSGAPEFDLIIQIRKDSPTGNLLSELVYTSAQVSSSWQWFNVDFNDIAVTQGETYCIVISPPPNSVSTSDGYEWGYAEDNLYNNGCYWYTSDNGQVWTALCEMYDFCFKTYGTNNGQETYELTVNIQGQGSVTKNPDQPEYDPDTVVELTAIHDSGYAFYQWYGDKSGSTTTLDITMNSDITITAEFILIGDAGQEGSVDTGDITLVERMIMDLIPDTPEADANQDGRIDAGDITAIEIIIMNAP